MYDTPVLDDTPAYLRDTELAALDDDYDDDATLVNAAYGRVGRVASSTNS